MTIGQTIWGSVGIVGSLVGGIPFFQADGSQAVDPAKLFWDDPTDRLRVSGLEVYTPTQLVNSITNYQRMRLSTVAAIGHYFTGGAAGTGVPNLPFFWLGSEGANPAFQVSPVANGSNYLNFAQGIAGSGNVSITANGADANINISSNAKGNNGHYFNTLGGASTDFVVLSSGSVNTGWMSTYGGAAFANTVAQGTVANVTIQTLSKGSGIAYVGSTSSGVQFGVLPTVNAVNQITATGSITGTSPTNNVILGAQGVDANIGITLAHKGTGVLQFLGQTVGTGAGISAGGATALPATPRGYLTVNLNALGDVRIPYYN